MSSTSRYEQRGVSANKSEVHEAIQNLDKGLFPKAFCKILPDTLTHSKEHAIVMHCDTAGTKPSLAYLYWKETGDTSVWKNIAQDALVMNLDDMACIGITDNFTISSNIARNKKHITGDVLKYLINGTHLLIQEFQKQGITIHHAGGETADVGDIVRTLDVGFTAIGRIAKKELIVNNIKKEDVIVAFSSHGICSYETEYNSGIGSNGLTSARHDLLSHEYANKYPESFDPFINPALVYTGKNKVTDIDPITNTSIGKLILSPTRSFVPLLSRIFNTIDRQKLNGIIHCTGGGQTKVLKFIEGIHVIKDNLMPIPPIFKRIQEDTNTSSKEMFQTFNMGSRLEIYTDQVTAKSLIDIASTLSIEAKIIGYTENSTENKVTIKHQGQVLEYV